MEQEAEEIVSSDTPREDADTSVSGGLVTSVFEKFLSIVVRLDLSSVTVGDNRGAQSDKRGGQIENCGVQSDKRGGQIENRGVQSNKCGAQSIAGVGQSARLVSKLLRNAKHVLKIPDFIQYGSDLVRCLYDVDNENFSKLRGNDYIFGLFKAVWPKESDGFFGRKEIRFLIILGFIRAALLHISLRLTRLLTQLALESRTQGNLRSFGRRQLFVTLSRRSAVYFRVGICLALVSVTQVALSRYLNGQLQIVFRTKLTRIIHEMYFQHNNFYHVSNTTYSNGSHHHSGGHHHSITDRSPVKNTDQRSQSAFHSGKAQKCGNPHDLICRDLQAMASHMAYLVDAITTAFPTIVYLTGVVGYRHSLTLALVPYIYLVVAKKIQSLILGSKALSYDTLHSTIAASHGARNAYHHSVNIVHHNAEAIALQEATVGEVAVRERNLLQKKFREASNQEKEASNLKHMVHSIAHYLYGYGYRPWVSLFAILALLRNSDFQEGFCTTDTLAEGGNQVGKLIAEMRYLGSLLMQMVIVLGSFITIHSRQGHYQHLAARILALVESLTRLSAQEQEDAVKRAVTKGEMRSSSNDKPNYPIEFSNFDITTAYGATLVRNLNFVIDKRHILITGHKKVGKSSIVRCIAGLCPVNDLNFSINIGETDISYLSSAPYFFEGTLPGNLLQQLYYPDQPPEEKPHATLEKQLKILLKLFGLETFASARNPLDTIVESEKLSLGEQQRLAIVRLLFKSVLSRPKYVVLDDCTNACPSDVESLLYRECQRAGITYITLSHRSSGLQEFHNQQLHLLGDGKYTVKDLTYEGFPSNPTSKQTTSKQTAPKLTASKQTLSKVSSVEGKSNPDHIIGGSVGAQSNVRAAAESNPQGKYGLVAGSSVEANSNLEEKSSLEAQSSLRTEQSLGTHRNSVKSESDFPYAILKPVMKPIMSDAMFSVEGVSDQYASANDLRSDLAPSAFDSAEDEESRFQSGVAERSSTGSSRNGEGPDSPLSLSKTTSSPSQHILYNQCIPDRYFENERSAPYRTETLPDNMMESDANVGGSETGDDSSTLGSFRSSPRSSPEKQPKSLRKRMAKTLISYPRLMNFLLPSSRLQDFVMEFAEDSASLFSPGKRRAQHGSAKQNGNAYWNMDWTGREDFGDTNSPMKTMKSPSKDSVEKPEREKAFSISPQKISPQKRDGAISQKKDGSLRISPNASDEGVPNNSSASSESMLREGLVARSSGKADSKKRGSSFTILKAIGILRLAIPENNNLLIAVLVSMFGRTLHWEAWALLQRWQVKLLVGRTGGRKTSLLPFVIATFLQGLLATALDGWSDICRNNLVHRLNAVLGNRFLRKYLTHDQFYQIQQLTSCKDAHYRGTTELLELCNSSVNLLNMCASSMTDIVWFLSRLYLGGFFQDGMARASAVKYFLLFYTIGSNLILRLGLANLTLFRKPEKEEEFAFMNMHRKVFANSETIALNRGGAMEQRECDVALTNLSVTGERRHAAETWNRFLTGFFMKDAPGGLWFLDLPDLFSLYLQQIGLTSFPNDYGYVDTSLKRIFEALGMVSSVVFQPSEEVDAFYGTVDRVFDLFQIMNKQERRHCFEGTTVGNSGIGMSSFDPHYLSSSNNFAPAGNLPRAVVSITDRQRLQTSNSGRIEIYNLDIVTPDNRCLATNLHLSLPVSGPNGNSSSLLVTGPIGYGKTALVRQLTGLWSIRRGLVKRPNRLLVMSQSVYIAPGLSLVEQVSYPDTAPERPQEKFNLRGKTDTMLGKSRAIDASSTQTGFVPHVQAFAHTQYNSYYHRVRTALQKVGLHDVRDDFPGWEHWLTAGDRQRLSLARIFFQISKLREGNSGAGCVGNTASGTGFSSISSSSLGRSTSGISSSRKFGSPNKNSNYITVILDESMNALSETVEHELYERLLEEGQIQIIFVSRRPSLMEYHDKILKLGINDSVEGYQLWE